MHFHHCYPSVASLYTVKPTINMYLASSDAKNSCLALVAISLFCRKEDLKHLIDICISFFHLISPLCCLTYMMCITITYLIKGWHHLALMFFPLSLNNWQRGWPHCPPDVQRELSDKKRIDSDIARFKAGSEHKVFFLSWFWLIFVFQNSFK